jgi:hypothetical protein
LPPSSSPEYRRDWYAKNKERQRAIALAWRNAHLEEARAKNRRYIAKLKLDTILAYGGYCACCYETELVFLTIDHINGGGNKHRQSLGLKGGMDFYRWLRKQGYPDGFQVLCMNCQWGKRYNGICPHEQQ